MQIKCEIIELRAAKGGKVQVTLLVDNDQIAGNILYKHGSLSVNMPVKTTDIKGKQIKVGDILISRQGVLTEVTGVHDGWLRGIPHPINNWPAHIKLPPLVKIGTQSKDWYVLGDNTMSENELISRGQPIWAAVD